MPLDTPSPQKCVLLRWDAFAVTVPQTLDQLRLVIERFEETEELLKLMRSREDRKVSRFVFIVGAKPSGQSAAAPAGSSADFQVTSTALKARARRRIERLGQDVRASSVPTVVSAELNNIRLEGSLVSTAAVRYEVGEE
jgi:hypothetical protein